MPENSWPTSEEPVHVLVSIRIAERFTGEIHIPMARVYYDQMCASGCVPDDVKSQIGHALMDYDVTVTDGSGDHGSRD